MSQVYVAKSEPIKLTAFLYPLEGYILVMDEVHHHKLFCPFGLTAVKVDEIDGRTYVEVNMTETSSNTTIANIICAEKKTNDTNQA